MKFLCFGYFDPAKMDALSPDEVSAAMRECPAHMDTIYATGKVSFVAGADNDARYLQIADGKLGVTDVAKGTANAKIGCVFILEASDMGEAVRLASLHPTTQVAVGEHLGWYTEIRPIHYFYGGEGSPPEMGNSNPPSATI